MEVCGRSIEGGIDEYVEGMRGDVEGHGGSIEGCRVE